MRQTLFTIPMDSGIAGWPLFGNGILLIVWGIFSICLLAWLMRRQGFNADTLGYVPLLILTGIVIRYVIPVLAEGGSLPVRGYGVLLVIAIGAAVGLAIVRAKQIGFDPELVLSLAFWLFLAGLFGARLFYIIEYWEDYRRGTWGETLAQIVNISRGGLVVYGSLIAGALAVILFVRKHGLSFLAVGDLIAPSVVLGMAIGRIGCFLNGCCYGGYCELPWAVQFPQNSPPYMDQASAGKLWGMHISPAAKGDTLPLPVVDSVEANGPAASAGLQAGDRIAAINGFPIANEEQKDLALQSVAHSGEPLALTTDRAVIRITASPAVLARSLPVHPTQLYSTIDALLLCLFLWSYYPFRRRVGEVSAWLLVLHPISRFLLELIRIDEPGMFGTPFSIGQLISMGIFAIGCCMWTYLFVRQEPIAEPRLAV